MMISTLFGPSFCIMWHVCCAGTGFVGVGRGGGFESRVMQLLLGMHCFVSVITRLDSIKRRNTMS